jgi:hypothetical protein
VHRARPQLGETKRYNTSFTAGTVAEYRCGDSRDCCWSQAHTQTRRDALPFPTLSSIEFLLRPAARLRREVRARANGRLLCVVSLPVTALSQERGWIASVAIGYPRSIMPERTRGGTLDP